MIKKILISLIIILPSLLSAQELNCRVSVQAREIQDLTDDERRNMENNIREFMNNHIWTDKIFDEHEKIEMSIKINITQKKSTTSFVASMQIVASRPVYNATYTSQIFSFFEDNIPFDYEEYQVLEFDENTFITNLTSVLAFYTYVIIGIDSDTFAKEGGTSFFQKAQNVVSAAQSASDGNWSSTNKENRYWMIENILNSNNKGYRSCLYQYHRLGLDIMHKDIPGARKNILAALYELEKVYKLKPNSFILTVFFYAKSDELIDIFSEGQPAEIKEAVDLMKKMNPANASDYDKLLK